MYKSSIQPLMGLSLVCSLLYSCNGNAGKQFLTKEDSVSFAQAVLEKYPENSSVEKISQDTTLPVKGRTFQESNGMKPIDTKTVLFYSSNYDKDPQLKSPKGEYYKGFIIDTAGYGTLIKTPSIKGVFLRLGKKEDGSYTIMVLGLDAKGKVIQTTETDAAEKDKPNDDPTNFDHLNSCPQICP